MRKKGFLVILTLICIVGCKQDEPQFTDIEIELMPNPQTTGLPQPTGGFVLAIGPDTITSNEVAQALLAPFRELAQNTSFTYFKKQARPDVKSFVVNKISNILLYQQAKLNAPEQIDERLKKAVDDEVRRFIAEFGGDYAKADEALKQNGFTGWQDFREYQKRLILSQSYIATKMPEEKPVTYDEMINYYNAVKDKLYVRPAQISIQLIDIQPEKLKPADPNLTKLQAAENLADALIQRIRAGEDFGQLAKQFSHGPWAPFGGLWESRNPDSLAEPYDILAKQAKNIEPGQIAGPIKTNGHILIMNLLEKQNESVEPFEKVQQDIKRKILAERRQKAANEIGLKLIQQADIANLDEFIEFCLVKIYEKNNI